MTGIISIHPQVAYPKGFQLFFPGYGSWYHHRLTYKCLPQNVALRSEHTVPVGGLTVTNKSCPDPSLITDSLGGKKNPDARLPISTV